jgi:hypothetical protein
MTNERFGRTRNTAAQFKPRRKNMKLLETWQIREALKYAGGPYDDQYMEWLTRALNYFNLSNNNLRCHWTDGTNGSGFPRVWLPDSCWTSPVLQGARGSLGRQGFSRRHGRHMQFTGINPGKCSPTFAWK